MPQGNRVHPISAPVNAAYLVTAVPSEYRGAMDSTERIPDDERAVPLDDDVEFELPPPTIDPLESIEEDEDEVADEEREAAIEAGEIDPGA